MDLLARQLRYTLRGLGRSPAFTATAVLTLALGIGATTAIFSVVHGVLLKPLPFAEPERLVGIWHEAPGMGWTEVNQSPALYFTYRDESETFAESGMWNSDVVTVTGTGEPEELPALRVTDGTLPLLGVRPHLGRLFTTADDSPGTPETVLLSHGFWRRRFGADPSAVGQVLPVDGRPREIIGVLPADLQFLDYDPDLYLPFRFDRGEVWFGNFSYQGIARLEDGVSLEQANADVARMIPIALDSFPMPPGFTRRMAEEARLGPTLRPLKEDVVGDVGRALWILLGTVGIVLLVACANVANLLLVRAEGRQQQLAVRTALGAGRGRLGGELLAESLALGLAGGAAGLGLAAGALRLLRALDPRGLPRLDEIGLDPVVLLVTLGLSVLAPVAFGSLPVARLKLADLVAALKEEGRGGTAGARSRRVRDVLVAAQVALALVLMIGSGLMVRSFLALQRVAPGFEAPAEVLTLRAPVPTAEVEDPAEVALVHERILAALTRLPGVTSAGMSSSVTMDGRTSMDPIFLEDFPVPEGQIPALRRFKWIAPGYFETLGNPVLAGRAISWPDVHERRPVAVVTRNFAREHWDSPGEALGRRIRINPGSPWREIVGVVGDVRDAGVDQEATAIVYWPMAIADFWDEELFVPRSMAFAVRSPRVGSESFLEEVRAAVWSVNPRLPLAQVRTLDEILARSLARTSFTLVMLGIAAATALLLGGVGIYGVTAYSVAQRSREIGVRMALGARRSDVSRLVLRQGLALAGIGVVVGLGAAVGLTRLMSALLYGVAPLDPPTFAAAGFGVALLALAASWLPARRAARVDPVETLY
ncbi:MAG TPA: ABC transporter permease [Thermoanaerobaculia bacterium]|nr:ABC transporter permease [Thermoanaerobaculia bacterium]